MICGANVEGDAEEKRLKLETAVRYFDNCSRAMCGETRFARVAGRTMVYDTTVVLEVLRRARVINGDNLNVVVQRCIQVAFPYVMHKALAEMFESQHGMSLPSGAQRHRYRLSFDASLMLLERKSFDLLVRPVVIFGMADGSPQHGRDWLSSRYDYILLHKLRQCFDASSRLTADRYIRERLGEDSLDIERHDADVEFLAHHIMTRDAIPSCIGRGHQKGHGLHRISCKHSRARRLVQKS